MKRSLLFLPFSLLYFSVASCIEPIVMDPMEEMPVVVSCILTRDGDSNMEHPEDYSDYEPPMQYLDLFYARTPSQEGYEPIDDAVVRVTGFGETYDFVWNGERWECAFMPHFDIVYNLSIKTVDGHELSSSMKFPPDCRLKRYRLIDHAHMDYFGNSLAGYYYLQRHYDNYQGICRFETFRGECFMWVRALENKIPVRKVCTNHPGVDDFNLRWDVWGDCAVIDLYADQFKSMATNENERYAHYNSDEYIGSVGLTPPIYIEPQLWDRFAHAWLSSPLHDIFMRIHHPEGFDSGMNKPWDYYVANDFQQQPAEPRDLFVLGADFDPSPKIDKYVDENGHEQESIFPWYFRDAFEVRFVSETYDKYLKSSVERATIHGDELFMLYSAEPVYSNIEGGVGCFGGQWITQIEMSTGY